jgi:hypothetical protein
VALAIVALCLVSAARNYNDLEDVLLRVMAARSLVLVESNVGLDQSDSRSHYSDD